MVDTVELQAQEDFYDTINRVEKEDRAKEPQSYLVALAVLDSSIPGVFIYDVDAGWNSERIETFLYEQGRRVKDCDWLVFDGEITDLRNE